jgi:hypothetical protein
MLIEAAVYLLSFPATPAPFRRHIGEAIGLWARGRRQRAAWRDHVARTRAAIEGRMAHIGKGGTAVVLGSGPLLDVPLDALAQRFKTVVLVDRAHLVGARGQALRYPNARFEWRDLSAATSAAPPLEFLHDIPDLDWVISVNLLSQLAHGAPDGKERLVVDAHLAELAALPCPITLITDLTYERHDRAGRRLEQFDLLYGRQMPEPRSSWSWEVAPFGEESPSTRRTHSVAAYPDWSAGAAQV